MKLVFILLYFVYIVGISITHADETLLHGDVLGIDNNDEFQYEVEDMPRIEQLDVTENSQIIDDGTGRVFSDDMEKQDHYFEITEGDQIDILNHSHLSYQEINENGLNKESVFTNDTYNVDIVPETKAQEANLSSSLIRTEDDMSVWELVVAQVRRDLSPFIMLFSYITSVIVSRNWIEGLFKQITTKVNLVIGRYHRKMYA